MMEQIPICEKYTLTIMEASVYFNMGEKRLRRLIAENPTAFSIQCGNKQLIVRHKLEKFIDETTAI